MGYALKHPTADKKKQKRSPLAGLLGRKGVQAEDDNAPQINAEAGLNRVLNAKPSLPPVKKSANDAPVHDALAAIEAALYSIDQIRDIIEQAYDVALSAREVEDAGGRALLAESYDDLRLSINTTIDNIDDQGASLIGKSQHHIDVPLGGKAHYSISPTRLDVSSKGLNLDPPRDAFATFDELTQIMEELDKAIKRADRTAAGYCRDAQYLIARLNSKTDESDALSA